MLDLYTLYTLGTLNLLIYFLAIKKAVQSQYYYVLLLCVYIRIHIYI